VVPYPAIAKQLIPVDVAVRRTKYNVLYAVMQMNMIMEIGPLFQYIQKLL
jgi:hypothetical protein